MGRLLGLDLGSRNVGIAISDESAILAVPHSVINRIPEDDFFKKLEDIVRNENIEKIIVGLPLNMNATQGERAMDAQRVSQNIEKKLNLPVVLWDERLPTREAENALIKMDVSRKKRKKVIDKIAAQIILQNYLDSI